MTSIIKAKETADAQKNSLLRKSVGKDTVETKLNSLFSKRFIKSMAADVLETSLFSMRFIKGTAADAQDASFFPVRVAIDKTGDHEKFIFRELVTIDIVELSAVIF